MGRLVFLLFFSISFLSKAEAQGIIQHDTLSLSLNDAENLFLKNNFYLLAGKFQINEATAALIQTKLWDNPNLSIEKEAYNKPSGRWFNIPGTGEIALSVQQLITIAGKRNKRINIEKYNVEISQYQFYDLIRTLRFELRTTFFELYFSELSLSVYDLEINALKSIVDAYSVEYQKGNIPFRELARLQSLLFNLENEKIDVLKNQTEKQSNLILLTGDTLIRPIKPLLKVSDFDSLSWESLKLGDLIDLGMKNRYDLRIPETQIKSEEMNLSLQKALRIPDVTIGANYDRTGSYIPNYNSLSLSFDLPFWNRNQGNILLSKNKLEENKVLKAQKELEVKNDIVKALAQFVETDRLYKSSLQRFDSNYDKLFSGINASYKNHSISLLEFVDYYETIKNSKNEYYQLQNNRLDAMENLNLATGTTLIK
jgi:outer membrane protein, heavy metal efflux system